MPGERRYAAAPLMFSNRVQELLIESQKIAEQRRLKFHPLVADLPGIADQERTYKSGEQRDANGDPVVFRRKQMRRDADLRTDKCQFADGGHHQRRSERIPVRIPGR